MKTILLAAIVALGAIACVERPVDAGRKVGAVTIDLENRSVARKFAVEFWYEAVPSAKVENLSFRVPLKSLPLARDAEARSSLGKRPLIVLSHGNWGSRYSLGWLALHLVNAGYVVISVSHPGTMGEDQTVAGRYRLWDRATDVSFALDEILKNPKWASLIDERRIGFVGHSFGGWTGVSLAGGRYDPARQRAFCTKMQKKDFYCEGTLKDDVSSISVSDAENSFRDARIGAYYIMGSGPSQGFSEASLNSINVPFMVDTAEFDDILEPHANSSLWAASIPGAKEIVRPIGHFTYVPECRWLVGPILTWIAGFPVCDDPEKVDRAAVHQLVAYDVIKFFGVELHK